MATALQENNKPAPGAQMAQHEIVVVPSASFFVRSLELPAGIERGEIESFVEVALEDISPFGLNQIYWGYYLPPQAVRVIVFAAYRKNLAPEATDDSWTDATLVVPGFVAALGMKMEGPGAVVFEGTEELTVLYWPESARAPQSVISRRKDTGDNQVATAELQKKALERAGVPDSVPVTVLEAPNTAEFRNKALVFDLNRPGGSEGPTAEIPRPGFWSLDVRDKDFLVAKRKELTQNRWLWNAVLFFVVAFGLLAVLELGLYAGSRVMATRAQQVADIAPTVEKIQQQEELASLLEGLGEQRLLPFEMLDYINELRPDSIHFTRVATVDSRGLRAEAVTPESADVSRYEERLSASPALAAVNIQNLRSRDGGEYTFTLAVTFSEDELPARRPQARTDVDADEAAAAGENARPSGEEGPSI